ncbi:hypothetical protein EDD16DRAFT_1526110 [Pisolithus croceorrhizus]|nr:hypothetical protein EDD16DRAFT_1526110 [Pisolithus croceorrhizus]KAI6167157.1 hypothetical protein EDD17DRAFT_1504857 [Pisolithus thermaeus]
MPMHSHRLIFKYISDSGENFPIQVTFLHDGHAVACRSTDGNVMVWDIANEDQIQVLPHDGHPVQAISVVLFHFVYSALLIQLINTKTSHYLLQAHLTHPKTCTSEFGVQTPMFICQKMVQSRRFCHTVMDRRVADVPYTDKGRLSGIRQINLAEILNMVSNNVKQIHRGAVNVLGNWAQALQGEEGDTMDV